MIGQRTHHQGSHQAATGVCPTRAARATCTCLLNSPVQIATMPPLRISTTRTRSKSPIHLFFRSRLYLSLQQWLPLLLLHLPTISCKVLCLECYPARYGMTSLLSHLWYTKTNRRHTLRIRIGIDPASLRRRRATVYYCEHARRHMQKVKKCF
jgi:hypothetical protein